MSSISKTNKNNQQVPKNTQQNTEKNPADKTVANNLSRNISVTENVQEDKEIVQPMSPLNLAIVR
jgi:hypothetical protein